MKILLGIACLMVVSLTASAQDYPKVEIFGGYSYLRTDSTTTDLTSTGIPGTAFQDSANLNGFSLSVTGNLHRRIGIAADFGGYFGTINNRFSSQTLSLAFPADTSNYSLLFGPQFSWRSKESKNTFYLRPMMVGFVHGKQTATVLGVTDSDTQNVFAASIGAGFDRKVAKKISIRILQADALLTRFDQGTGGRNQVNVRLSTGIVFRP
ncbi:MAG TPA: hypothetical protein VJ302_07875 [Blastocatellia bacterium]|nr:hypothetical protein [Blastocatellia bacterium]